MWLFSPAKINLFFRVLSKRADGYHEIASIYQAIQLGDWVEVSLADEDRLSCSLPSLENPSNLAAKACSLFRKKTGLSFFAHINLQKQIPLQSGLGGGSSNAATVLWACNTLLGNPVAERELELWAGEIGSDAPFFFSTGTAYCRGRGELVQSLSLPFPFSASLAKPPFGLSTPLVYGAVNLSSLPKRDPDGVVSDFLRANPFYFNDLEQSAFQINDEMAQIKNGLLERGFSSVVMSGSGSSFFCIGENRFSSLASNALSWWNEVKGCQRKVGEWYSFPVE